MPADDLADVALAGAQQTALVVVAAEPAERCPAATGEITHAGGRCPVHPGGAHRCYRAPQHQQAEAEEAAAPVGRTAADHVCDCGFVWCSAAGGVAELSEQQDRVMRGGVERALQTVLTRLTDLGYEMTDAEWRRAAGAGGDVRGPVSATGVVRGVARDAGVDL